MITSFIEQRLSEDVSYGAKGGPKFKTEVFTAASGAEQRNVNWAEARCEYDISFGIRDKADMDEVLAFFYNVRGKGTGFRFKDWTDFELVNEKIGTGDGTKTEFQAIKTYDNGSAQPYVRRIRKVANTNISGVTVGGVLKVENTDFTVDKNTGIFTFSVAPANGEDVVIGSMEFDVPVRFDIDKLDIVAEAFQIESIPSIKLVEVNTDA